MDPNAIFEHLCYRLFNTPIQPYPFPHFQAFNVFPKSYYDTILNSLPPDSSYTSNDASSYNGRRFADTSSFPLRDHLLSERFIRSAAAHFFPWFPKISGKVTTELRLIRDGRDYFIGPHTDAPWKLLSLLFYLPPDDTLSRHGTSLYVPNDPSFRCPGGPHHAFDLFQRIHTAPFVPNSCLGFLKTDHSFHGVEPITIPCQRDVLLWNLYRLPPDSDTMPAPT